MNSKINYLREFGKFRLDAEKKVLWFEDEPVNLALKEIELLCVLTENSGEVITKDELLNRVWADSFVEESNLSRHIYRLRKTFEEFGESSDLIQTVPRRGYRFRGEIHAHDNGDLVIERHSISRTLIEELENSAEPNLKVIPAANSQNYRGYLFLPITICLVILVTGLGFYFFNRDKQTLPSNQPIKSIAVLPLKSLSNEENDKALSLGFADALIARLGKLDEIKVLSTNTVIRFTDERQEPLEIGKELNVDAVIDGTLQRANGKLRITLRLIRISNGKQIWSNSFDKTETDIFPLQDLLARETAQALILNLKSEDNLKHPTENLDAYQFYLQGQYLFRHRLTGKSIPFFKKAIEIDQKFARAWVGLAAAYAMGDAMDKAEVTVNKALELEPDLAEAHAVRGFVKLFLDWNWVEAEKSLNRAVELDQNSVEAHHWRSIYLAIGGRFDEAKAEMNRALELDLTSANIISDLGQIYYFSRDYAKAEEYYRKAELLGEPFSVARRNDLNHLQKREKEALETELLLNCKSVDKTEKEKCFGDFKNRYQRQGMKGVITYILKIYLKIVTDKKTAKHSLSVNWYHTSKLYLRLGEKEKAIDCLIRSWETKTPDEIMNFTFPFIGVDPTFEDLRSDPRFQAILKKMNLP